MTARDVIVVWECECGYRSLVAGRCRSHPYPLRALGPDMGEPAEYARVESESEGVVVERDEIERVETALAVAEPWATAADYRLHHLGWYDMERLDAALALVRRWKESAPRDSVT